ncbi:MAG: cell division protein ZapB [Gemmatimonadetes bacterium]|nr:cell division protein ZapB [Gemmatimonadota bacterium]
MELELLDQLEDKVDVAVTAVQELRIENDLLKEETQDLEKRVEALSQDAKSAGTAKEEVTRLTTRCEDLEKKLEGVRGRIEKMVGKMKSLEG